MMKQSVLSILLCLLPYSVLSCDLNNAEPLLVELPSLLNDTQSRKVVVSNNTKSDLLHSPAILFMHGADDMALIDKVDQWPAPDDNINSIYADPVAIDDNYDGVADAIYVVNESGLLWFIPLLGAGFSAPVLIADFSASGLSFRQPVQMVQYTTLSQNSQQRPQVMLLLIANHAQNGDVLLAVKHQRDLPTAVTFANLIDRTVVADSEVSQGIAESLWLQIQQGSGWFIQLEDKLINLPKVYAGVIYFSAADASLVNSDCSLSENSVQQLYAVHLHHAGLVYSKRNWQVDSSTTGDIRLAHSEHDQLQLVLQGEQQQTAIDAMLGISELCANCVEALTAEQFPQIKRLATFQSEVF